MEGIGLPSAGHQSFVPASVESLAEGIAALSAMSSMVPFGLYVTDPDGDCVWASDRWLEMAGLSMDEARGQGWTEGIHPEDRAKIGEDWYRSVRSGGHWLYDYRFMDRTGRVTWVRGSASALVDAEGTPLGYVGVNLDVTEVVELREALEARELVTMERMRDLAEQVAGVGCWRWDLDTRKSTWSPGMTRLFQADVADYGGDMGPILAARVHPDDLPAMDRATAETLQRAGPSDTGPPEVDFRVVHDDGSVCLLHGEGTLERDPEGRAVAVNGYCQDVTAIRALEFELRELIDSLPVGVVVHAPDTSIIDSNPEASRILGLTSDQMLGREAIDPCWHFTSQDGSILPLAEYPVNQVLESNAPVKNVILGVHWPGREGPGWCLCNGYPIRTNSGELEKIAIAFADITDTVESAAALQQSEARYRTLTRSVHEGVVLQLRDGTILSFNPAAEEMFGISEEEALRNTSTSRDWGTIREDGSPFPGEEHPTMVTFATGERVTDVTLGVKQADGSVRWLNVNSNPVFREGEAEPYAAVVSFSDVTDKKRAEDDLQSLNESLEQRVEERTAELQSTNEELVEANEAKTQFLRSMSHELRTPLNSVIGFSGLMLQGTTGPLNDEQERQLGMIHNSGEHLLALINDILDLSRIEAGRLELQFARIDVSEVVRRAVETLTPEADAKGLDLRLDTCTPPCWLLTDETRLSQIVINLVGNAVKYTSSGVVTVRSECGSPTTMAISVNDTGPGIAEADRQRIFGEFTRIPDADSAPDQEGTGLGLAISRGLAAALGGNLELQTELGRGSTFTLTLPRLSERTEGTGSLPSASS